MDEIKMDADLAAKFNGKKVRLVDDRGAVVGYYLPAADYAAGVPAGLAPEPPFTEAEIAEMFARPLDPTAYRPWEELSAEMRRGR